MTTIFERVETALGTISPAVPFALSPYKGTLPDAYIVHQLIDSPTEQHADGVETERSYKVQITLWDKAGVPSTTKVDAAMSAAGFYKGNVRQLPQDAQTHHYGLAVEFVYV
jgi:hypothetical protein